MTETKIPVGSWVGDLGGYADTLIAKAEALVDKYQGQAGAMASAARKIADAVRAFIAAPGFDTGATLYYLVMAFPVPVMGAGETCRATAAKAAGAAEMAAITWTDLAKYAELIAGILAKFL